MEKCSKCNGKRNHRPERVPASIRLYEGELRCIAVCEDCGYRELCTYNPSKVVLPLL